MLESIDALTAKVDRHKAEVARLAASGGAASTLTGGGGLKSVAADSTLSRCTEETASTFSDSEEGKGLLRQQQKKAGGEAAAVERSTLEIEIEPNVASLRSSEAVVGGRDRRIHPELVAEEEEA